MSEHEQIIPLWAREIAVFDTETTGLAVETTRIVTAHISVLDESGESHRARDWLINPGIEIPERASAVHGVTTEYARENGSDPEGAIYDIVTHLQTLFDEGIAVVAYNAAYDFSILNREALRYGLAPLENPRPIVDPMVIDKFVDRYRQGKRTLSAATIHYGITLDNAHDASADAIAAGRVAQALARKFPDQLNMSALELHDKQIGWSAEQAASFAEFLRKKGEKPFRDDGLWPVR